MNDALEILDEFESLIESNAWYSNDAMIEALHLYIERKRLEFAEPKGDCCGT